MRRAGGRADRRAGGQFGPRNPARVHSVRPTVPDRIPMRPMRLATALLALSACPAARLPAQVPGGKLTPAIRAAVIDTVAAQLGRVYVEADTGLLIGANLKKRLAAGAYESLENPGQFAEMVTRDLRA